METSDNIICKDRASADTNYSYFIDETTEKEIDLYITRVISIS